MLYYDTFHSAMGNLIVYVKDDKLYAILFEKELPYEAVHNIQKVKPFIAQLKAYFAGKRTFFDMPLCMDTGTPFQQKVWQALLQIPYGATVSYQDIAKKVGSPLACRAVGMANHRNKIPIIIPCHRVIAQNGKLTGYAGGLDKKEFLLALEQKYKSCE